MTTLMRKFEREMEMLNLKMNQIARDEFTPEVRDSAHELEQLTLTLQQELEDLKDK